MHSRVWGRLVASCFLGLALLPGAARGQKPAPPVAIAQHTEAVAAPPAAPDQTVVSLSAGATLNEGNTRSYAGNLGGRIALIRHPHQFTVEALGTLGGAKNEATGDVEKTSANVLGRARYDLFLSENNALFVALQPRRDTFAGLDLRLQSQVGYLRNLFTSGDNHRLWTELGYDLTYDNFATLTTTATVDATAEVLEELGLPPGTMVPDGVSVTRAVTSSVTPANDFVHSGRVFLGYRNAVNTAATLNGGVEFLYDIEDPANIRVNGLAEVTSSLSQRFKLGVQARLFYDRVPVPGKEPWDLVLAAQLVYTFDSLAEAAAAAAAAAAAPAPCDCTAECAGQVQAALEGCAQAPAQEVPAAPEPEQPAGEQPQGEQPAEPAQPEASPEGASAV